MTCPGVVLNVEMSYSNNKLVDLAVKTLICGKKSILFKSSILCSPIPLVSQKKSPEKYTLGKKIDKSFEIWSIYSNCVNFLSIQHISRPRFNTKIFFIYKSRKLSEQAKLDNTTKERPPPPGMVVRVIAEEVRATSFYLQNQWPYHKITNEKNKL